MITNLNVTVDTEQHQQDQVVLNEGKESPLDSFSSFSSTGNSKNNKAGVVTIIRSKKNGNRILLSKALMTNLDYATTLQLSFTETEIAIGENLPNNVHDFQVSKIGDKGAIYSKSLVEEITDLFSLDFNNCVSKTFYKVRYIDYQHKKVAIITVD